MPPIFTSCKNRAAAFSRRNYAVPNHTNLQRISRDPAGRNSFYPPRDRDRNAETADRRNNRNGLSPDTAVAGGIFAHSRREKREKESEKKVTQRKEKEKGPEREGLRLASQLSRIADAWNRLPLQKVNRFTEIRKARTETLLAQYPADEIIRAIESISHSRFLLGGGAKGWHIRFDWFIRPENFRKVLEGNYLDEEEESSIPCPATENCGAGQTPMFTAYNGSNQARLGYSEQDLQDINQLWTDSSDIKKGDPNERRKTYNTTRE